jgi:hypothetical protein
MGIAPGFGHRTWFRAWASGKKKRPKINRRPSPQKLVQLYDTTQLLAPQLLEYSGYESVLSPLPCKVQLNYPLRATVAQQGFCLSIKPVV